MKYRIGRPWKQGSPKNQTKPKPMQYLVGVLFKSYIKCFSKNVQGRKQDLDSLGFANGKVCVPPWAWFSNGCFDGISKKKSLPSVQLLDDLLRSLPPHLHEFLPSQDALLLGLAFVKNEKNTFGKKWKRYGVNCIYQCTGRWPWARPSWAGTSWPDFFKKTGTFSKEKNWENWLFIK